MTKKGEKKTVKSAAKRAEKGAKIKVKKLFTQKSIYRFLHVRHYEQ